MLKLEPWSSDQGPIRLPELSNKVFRTVSQINVAPRIDGNICTNTHLAYMDLRLGNIEKARLGFAEVIRQAYRQNHIDVLVWAVEGVASLQVDRRQFERAARLFAWVDAMREKLPASRAVIEQKFDERDVALIRTKLDEAEFAKFFEEGQAMTLEQAVALALEPASDETIL